VSRDTISRRSLRAARSGQRRHGADRHVERQPIAREDDGSVALIEQAWPALLLAKLMEVILAGAVSVR
jgi:hypothetical protein